MNTVVELPICRGECRLAVALSSLAYRELRLKRRQEMTNAKAMIKLSSRLMRREGQKDLKAC